MNLNTNEFFGLVKRKDCLGVLAYVFTELGEDEAAQAAKDTTRFTSAAVDRMRNALKDVDDKTPELPGVSNDHEIDAQVKDLDGLIAAGKKKKAKKLYKAMVESGLSGSEMDKRKNEIKGL